MAKRLNDVTAENMTATVGRWTARYYNDTGVIEVKRKGGSSALADAFGDKPVNKKYRAAKNMNVEDASRYLQMAIDKAKDEISNQ